MLRVRCQGEAAGALRARHWVASKLDHMRFGDEEHLRGTAERMTFLYFFPGAGLWPAITQFTDCCTQSSLQQRELEVSTFGQTSFCIAPTSSLPVQSANRNPEDRGPVPADMCVTVEAVC